MKMPFLSVRVTKMAVMAFLLGSLFAHSTPAVELLSDPGFEEANPDSATFGWRRHHSLDEPGAVIVARDGAHGRQDRGVVDAAGLDRGPDHRVEVAAVAQGVASAASS